MNLSQLLKKYAATEKIESAKAAPKLPSAVVKPKKELKALPPDEMPPVPADDLVDPTTPLNDGDWDA